MDDTSEKTNDPVDPELGKVQVEVQIKLNRDIGPTTYGSRTYRTEHEVSLSIGPDADPHRIKDYVGNAVAAFLRINEPHRGPEPVGFAIPLSKLLEDALKAELQDNNGKSDPDRPDQEDADTEAALQAHGHRRPD